MNIEIAKRGSSTVNISLNSRGGRSLNIPKTQGEKINLPPPTKPHVEKRDANKETSNPKSVIISINKKPNQEKTEKQDQSLNISFKQPESTINTKETPEIQYTTLPSCKTENKDQQKEYIKSVQQFINQILNDSPQINIGIKLQNKIDSLQKMIQTIMTYDDKILNESKIIIMIINLFLDDSIYKSNQYNDFYKIFFDNDNNFIIGNKLNQYFIYNDKNSIESIIKFTKKIFNIKLGNKQQIIKCFYNIKQKSTTFSKETSNILDDAIDEFENDFNLEKKKEFLFDESTMFTTIDDNDLYNDYQKEWPSIERYIQVMFNLTIENYFHPLRQHLSKLRNNELDPRDLYLYDHVKIYPSYEFNERSEHDIFIQFSIRAPDYKDGNTIKQRRIREIDWELTERLSNRSLLFFSFSPIMDKIEAVALSCAKKGTIKNNIIPIQFLKGYLEMDKEYYMYEPVDHWNGPFYDNLLSTNEISLPKCLIKPIISLDFSDNLIDNLNSIQIELMRLLRNQVGYKLPKFEILSTNEEVKFYMNEFLAKLEYKESDKEALFKIITSDLCKYLKDFERKRGKYKKFDENSDVVKGIDLELKRYTGFRIGNEKWPYDDFTEEEFRKKLYVDHEQYKAIKYCLSHHLTLVNGAPGTGKTYLACESIKLLIKSNYQYPILVVTYKNVSLDGLLDNIASFLENNKIDFARIGGRPRTENKFILSKILDRKIPLEVQRLKKQILYLTILGSKTQKSITYLENKKIDECCKFIINDIDKSINIREMMFDKYMFYDKEDEEIITNLLEPTSLIPTADEYFQCWINGNGYYNKLKAKKKNDFIQNRNNLLSEVIAFYYSKEGTEKKDVIIKIIKTQFLNNELLFRKFLHQHKKKITSKDISILQDIVYENKFTNESESFFDITQSSGNLKNYIRNTNNGMLPMKNQIIKDKFNHMLSNNDKINSFKQFLNELTIIINEQVKESRESCSQLMKDFEQKEVKEFGAELSKKRLIAMTATRAAQYKLSLDRCKCKFMIVEEAGELTEPMAFSIIPKTIQHLVMIGDYRQLRPTVEHKLTFPPYNYNISLFEKEIIHSKAIKSDNLFTLSIQRRMHPQISYLLRKVFYNDNQDDEKLNDDETTYQLEKPIGFPNHVQFWLHDFEEEVENKKMRSHVNVKEAQICAHLFLMMLCRGYKSSEITIISLYKGQKRQIEKEICKLIDAYYEDQSLISYDAFDFENDLPDYVKEKKEISELIEIRKSNAGKYVVCLDDFQGEENKVIIVSLTRSEKPGFVKNENRALVTLSRARQMEFIIGNKNVFGPQNERNPLWQKISSEAALIDDYAMHFNGIACCPCKIHNKQQKMIILSKPSDFIECRFNCCKEKCDCKCACGHKCQLPCHMHNLLIDDENRLFNRRYYCEEKCEKCCKMGHQCDEVCGNCMHFGCPPCPYNCPGMCSSHGCINKCSLPCSHTGECQCLCVGYCNDCNCQITELHDKLKFWNNSILVCTKCFYRRVEWRRKGHPDELYLFMNS